MRRFILTLLSFFFCFLGCTSTRSTQKGKRVAESQLTATTEENRNTEDRTATTATANTGSSEKQNVVIEFTKVEYYPEGQKPNRFTEQFQKADSAFNEEVRKALKTANGQSDKDQRHNTDSKGLKKPPNIKSLTTGRIVVNGNKQETTETNITIAAETEATETKKMAANTGIKETTQTEEEKYPKMNPFFWVLGGIGLAAVLSMGFYIRYKIVKKHK